MIHRPGEDTLSWGLDQPFPVGRTKAIRSATHERLDGCDFRTCQSVQFRQFDDPYATCLQRSILTVQVGQLICEILSCQRSQSGGLPNALRSFENQAAICLRARLINSCDCGDQPSRAHRTSVGAVLDSEINGEPMIQAFDSIPLQVVEVPPHGVKAAPSGYGLNRLAGNLDRYQDAVAL